MLQCPNHPPFSAEIGGYFADSVAPMCQLWQDRATLPSAKLEWRPNLACALQSQGKEAAFSRGEPKCERISRFARQIRKKGLKMPELIESLLLRDEGYRRSAYTDSLGYLTIGIGKLIDAKKGGGITFNEALYLLRNEVSAKEADLRSHLPWYDGLDEVRKALLLSMAFQIGSMGLLAFRNTLRAVEEGRWNDAADGMMASRWAQQTPLRAHRLAQTMRTGDVAALRLDEEPPNWPK